MGTLLHEFASSRMPRFLFSRAGYILQSLRALPREEQTCFPVVTHRMSKFVNEDVMNGL